MQQLLVPRRSSERSTRACYKFQEEVQSVTSRASYNLQEEGQNVASRASYKLQEEVPRRRSERNIKSVLQVPVLVSMNGVETCPINSHIYGYSLNGVKIRCGSCPPEHMECLPGLFTHRNACGEPQGLFAIQCAQYGCSVLRWARRL
jgi:hypothetical protein